jgi:hypothetical protein
MAGGRGKLRGAVEPRADCTGGRLHRPVLDCGRAAALVAELELDQAHADELDRGGGLGARISRRRRRIARAEGRRSAATPDRQ